MHYLNENNFFFREIWIVQGIHPWNSSNWSIVPDLKIQKKVLKEAEPADMRLNIDNSGLLQVKFTHKLKFNDEILAKLRKLNDPDASSNSRIVEVFAARRENRDADEPVHLILEDWKVLGFDNKAIKIACNFFDPLKVS